MPSTGLCTSCQQRLLWPADNTSDLRTHRSDHISSPAETRLDRRSQPESESFPLACCIAPRCARQRLLVYREYLFLYIQSTCQSVPRVHSRFGTRTLLCKTYDPDMQTPSELSHSSSSETDPGNLLEALHYRRQSIHFTGVSRVLKALVKSHNDLKLRTKLLLWLLVFYASAASLHRLLVDPAFHGAAPG